MALPLLLVQGLSGSVLGWPQLYEPAVRLLGPAAAWPQPASGSTGPRLSVDEVLARVQARWPQAQLRWVEVPGNNPATAYRVRMRLPGEPGERFPAGHVWLDARTGAVLAVRTPAQFSASDVFQQWLRPLHTGEALGWAGRILICVSGLLPLALAETGTLRWMHKRRALRTTRGTARTAAPARSRPAALAGGESPRGIDPGPPPPGTASILRSCQVHTRCP